MDCWKVDKLDGIGVPCNFSDNFLSDDIDSVLFSKVSCESPLFSLV